MKHHDAGAVVADEDRRSSGRTSPTRCADGLGLAIATVLAVPIGILLGTSELAGRALRVPIEFLRPIPSAVLIPLLFLTIGPSLKSEVFLAAFGAGRAPSAPKAEGVAAGFGGASAQPLL